MTLGSLFDGISGFPLAAVRQGIKPVWGSEIEADCIDISAKHFPDMQQLGDITKINGAEIPPVDIISFGSPCQNLSVAGNEEGLVGSESRLFFEAVRIIDEMRCATNGKYPKYAVWENVEGAFSCNKGRDFQKVLEEIAKTAIPMPASGRWARAGMVRSRGGSTAWRMLDAQYWGVPQRRKRIYLVRDFRTDRAGQILFECESMLGYSGTSQEEEEGGSGNPKESSIGEVSGGLEEEPDGQMKLPVYTIAGNIIGRIGIGGGNQLGINQDVAPTLTRTDRHAIAYAQSGFSEYKRNIVGATLTRTGGVLHGGGSTLIVTTKQLGKMVKYRVRRLTPLECERLDGFPDNWTQYGASGKEMSDNMRYMATGNSIAVPCAERVFRGIIAAEQEGREDG